MRAGPHRAARDASCHSVALVGLLCRRAVHEYALCAMLAGGLGSASCDPGPCVCSPRGARSCVQTFPERSYCRKGTWRAQARQKPAKTLLLRSRRGGTTGNAHPVIVPGGRLASSSGAESDNGKVQFSLFNSPLALSPRARRRVQKSNSKHIVHSRHAGNNWSTPPGSGDNGRWRLTGRARRFASTSMGLQVEHAPTAKWHL